MTRNDRMMAEPPFHCCPCMLNYIKLLKKLRKKTSLMFTQNKFSLLLEDANYCCNFPLEFVSSSISKVPSHRLSQFFI